MADPIQLAREAALLDEQQLQVFACELARARTGRQISEAGGLPQNPSKDQVALWLAREHFSADPAITDIWYLPGNAPAREIRFIESNALLAGLHEQDVIPIDFGFDVQGLNYQLLVADAAPNQWEQLQSGTLPLPPNWTLEGCRHFRRGQP
jgi:hypothetical protein